MDPIHFCSACAPLCTVPDARWCTILREAVTCPACVAMIAEREAGRCEAAREASRAEPRAVQPAAELLP